MSFSCTNRNRFVALSSDVVISSVIALANFHLDGPIALVEAHQLAADTLQRGVGGVGLGWHHLLTRLACWQVKAFPE